MEFTFRFMRQTGDEVIVTAEFRYLDRCDCNGDGHNHLDEVIICGVENEAGENVLLEPFEIVAVERLAEEEAADLLEDVA